MRPLCDVISNVNVIRLQCDVINNVNVVASVDDVNIVTSVSDGRVEKRDNIINTPFLCCFVLLFFLFFFRWTRYKRAPVSEILREPVWPSGKAVGW